MDIEDWINHITETSYDGKLKFISKINSVNCKEWEDEKKLFDSEFFGDKSRMATRCYFQLETPCYSKGKRKYHRGHIDFRPVSNSISDAFLPIPSKKNFFVTCKKPYKSDDSFDSVLLTVPYMTSDSKIALCSPATLWILLATLSKEFRKEYISLYEIRKNLSPSCREANSVSVKEYSKLFLEYDYLSHIYLGKRKKDLYDKCEREITISDDYCHKLLKSLYGAVRLEESDLKAPLMDWKTLYWYIESEIPVHLTFEAKKLMEEINYRGEIEEEDYYHSVVAIGHTLDDNNNVSNFIIHDVSYAPFISLSKEFIDQNLVEALVLLPKDINMRVEFCEELVNEIIDFYRKEIDDFFEDDSKIKLRAFLMSSQRVKFWFTNEEIYPKEICDIYSEADFPRYVWVFEISTSELRENTLLCKGHIIFNATLNINESKELELPFDQEISSNKYDYDPKNLLNQDTSIKSKPVILINLPKWSLWFQNKNKNTRRFIDPIFDSLPIFKYPFVPE